MASGEGEGELSWAAYQRRRSTCICLQDKTRKVRTEIASSKPRLGGQFTKPKAYVPPRAQEEREERAEKVLQKRLDRQIAESKQELEALKSAHAQALANLNDQLAKKTTTIRSLRAQIRLSKTDQPKEEAEESRKIQGGTSAPTRKKLADELHSFLNKRFLKPAQKQALFEHFQRHPTLYTPILNQGLTHATFQKACEENPDWLSPIRREVVQKIEQFWTLDKCLSIQLHCKVGHSEKYQHLINLTAKTYSPGTKEWVRHELFGKGSEIFVPRFKSKNEIAAHRTEIASEIPLLQDEAGTACWPDLRPLIVETLQDERKTGYLQTETPVQSLVVRVHWGGDAAGWYRGIKHTVLGFKLVGGGRVCNQSPNNLRLCLLYEGKDGYKEYLEYTGPLRDVIADLRENGIEVDRVHFTLIQTFGADYVLLAEVFGHAGHACIQGCIFCLMFKKDYGRVITNESGRRVPLPAERRTRKLMCLAAHRPLETGPDIACPFCHEAFPDEAAVRASVEPTTASEKTTYQQKHAGQRFGHPPLFDFELASVYICILHTLLRLIAVVFKRTIVNNLDTEEKVSN
jgi:hypothetical protein